MHGMSERLVGGNLEGEEAPFCFSATTGVDIRPAPLVYVQDLIGKITQLLDQNEELEISIVTIVTTLFLLLYSLNLLTWHDGAIPADEVWVKIGGDKGGTTLKANFQLCNNTFVFAVF